MLKLCFMGIHWWSKRSKQWIDGDKVVISKRCHHCSKLLATRRRIWESETTRKWLINTVEYIKAKRTKYLIKK